MNSNIPNSSSQINKISQISSGNNQSQDRNLLPNTHPTHPNISPVNQVSILKTEEQKEIVRTNVFEPNNTSSNNDKQFCVVTEVIKRKSNITFDSKSNAGNKVDIRFSFNKPIDSTLNQTFPNKTLNINIVGSRISPEQNKNEESYKLLIKRIASQLRNKIRPPTHGFFYFALQKGSYPLMIIKKLEGNIINHSIELNSDIFQEYSQKYLRYRELIKKIALLLKKNLQNKMFWENERYKNESIKVKITNKNTPNNANTKMNSHDHNVNIPNKKNNNTNIKSNLQNKKPITTKTPQINQTNNQRKGKSHITKLNNINNNKNNLSNPVSLKNNFGNHRLNNVTNPFNAIKTQTQNHKKGNLTKKIETNYNKNNLNNKSFKNKNVNINHQKNEDGRSASSETNKNGKIKFMNNPKIPHLSNKGDNKLIEEEKNNNQKIQVITLSKKAVNNSILNNPNSIKADNDIEMKDESNMINEEIPINNNIDNSANNTNNMNMIPHRNSASIMTNTNLNNPSIIRQNNVHKITFNSNKSPGKQLQIKFSPLKKSEEIINEIIKKSSSKKPLSSHKKEIKININEINIPLDDSKITDEHISFVNKLKVFMTDNNIFIEYNIPMSNEEDGINCLKKNEFWEKYIHYLYLNYLIDKKNKISLFTFIHLIEQYFLWCEFCDIEMANNFKNLMINIIKKVFSEKDIDQFLAINKMKNLEELFTKYERFIKYGNKNSYKKNKEVEIKIENEEECNCDLCQNEKACVKKISELNKKSNVNISIESIQIQAEYSPKAKKKTNSNNQLETNNYSITFEGKDKSGLFSKSKTLHTFETVYQYIPPKIEKENEKEEDIKEEELDIEEKTQTYPKRKNSKSKSKSKRQSISKKEENSDDKYIDVDVTKETKDSKLEEEIKEELEENKEEEVSSDNKSRSKRNNNKKNNKKNKKRNSYNIKDDSESESEEKEKNKKKKKQKSKSRNKSHTRKYPESDSESESLSDEIELNKNKNKKSYNNQRRKKGKSKW